MIEAYLIHLLILICIYVILAVSLQLAMGFTGLLNLGHVAFFAVGAYTSALLAMAGFPYWVCLVAAGLVGCLFGLVLSIPTNKLSGDYLALATMGFSFVVYAVALNWTDVTRGPLGIPGIPRPEFFGFVLSDNFSFLVFSLIVTAVSVAVIWRLASSPFGRVLGAIRDNELAARVLGKNAFKMKSVSLGVSAFFAGIAGRLYAHYITFIDPSSFTLLAVIPIIAIVIIGGLASIPGTIAAAVVLVLLPEPLRFIGFESSVVGPMRQILYALILLLILLYKPKGFLGKVKLE